MASLTRSQKRSATSYLYTDKHNLVNIKQYSSCSRLFSCIVPHGLTIIFLSSFLRFTLKQCQTLPKSLNHLSPNLLKTNPSGKECTRTFLWDCLIYIGGTKHSSLKYRHSLFHCGLALLWCLTRYVNNDYDKRLCL